MVNFVLALGAFFIEWFLLWALIMGVYLFFHQYLITRYLISYPFILVVYNVLGWVMSFCIWFLYMLLSLIKSSFIDPIPHYQNPHRTDQYMEHLGTFLEVSTLVMTIVAIRHIYLHEKEYWQDRKSNSKNP